MTQIDNRIDTRECIKCRLGQTRGWTGQTGDWFRDFWFRDLEICSYARPLIDVNFTKHQNKNTIADSGILRFAPVRARWLISTSINFRIKIQSLISGSWDLPEILHQRVPEISHLKIRNCMSVSPPIMTISWYILPMPRHPLTESRDFHLYLA